jgi:hypothetical protein
MTERDEVDVSEFTKPTAQERIDDALGYILVLQNCQTHGDAEISLPDALALIAQILRGEK